MATLEASHEGATLHMYEGITTQELNHRSESFKSALSEVVKKESGRSNMLLPPTLSNTVLSFIMPKRDIRKRMKMQVVVTQALFAERRVSFTANRKGATIAMDVAKLDGAAPRAMVSTIAIMPTTTISLTAHTTDVSRSESQVGRSGTNLNLVAYALQAFNCRQSGACWDLENIEHSFLKPPPAQVSPLDSIWS
jgi:hypothetical protein